MLRLTIQQDPALALTVGQNPTLGVSVAESIRGGSYPDYTGVYEITPTTEEQTLETRRRVMAENVTVHEIPYYETTNESGGYTVIIG